MLLMWWSALAQAGQTCRVPYQGAIRAEWLDPDEWLDTERKRAALELREPEALPEAMSGGAVSLVLRAPSIDWVSAEQFTVVVSKNGAALVRDVERASIGTGGRMWFVGTKLVPLPADLPVQITVVGPSAWSCVFDVDMDGRVRARFQP